MATYTQANSAYDLDGLVVPTKASAVYSAHESSLFLPGNLIPTVSIPAGSASIQVSKMGSVAAQKLTAASHAVDDFNVLGIADTKVTITADIHAARDVLRDLGAIDPADLGRVLGNAVSKSFDQSVIDAMDTVTQGVVTGAATLDVDDIFEAVETIRANGETGQLYGVLAPDAARSLMATIGTNAYAGGDFQTDAMRNGFVASVGGVLLFQSSYMDTNNGCIFGADAFRIGMFKNVDIEIQRRAAAVGVDIVASLHAGVGLVDGDRAVNLTDA